MHPNYMYKHHFSKPHTNKISEQLKCQVHTQASSSTKTTTTTMVSDHRKTKWSNQKAKVNNPINCYTCIVPESLFNQKIKNKNFCMKKQSNYELSRD